MFVGLFASRLVCGDWSAGLEKDRGDYRTSESVSWVLLSDLLRGFLISLIML